MKCQPLAGYRDRSIKTGGKRSLSDVAHRPLIGRLKTHWTLRLRD
jgi:hypothetical protein